MAKIPIVAPRFRRPARHEERVTQSRASLHEEAALIVEVHLVGRAVHQSPEVLAHARWRIDQAVGEVIEFLELAEERAPPEIERSGCVGRVPLHVLGGIARLGILSAPLGVLAPEREWTDPAGQLRTEHAVLEPGVIGMNRRVLVLERPGPLHDAPRYLEPLAHGHRGSGAPDNVRVEARSGFVLFRRARQGRQSKNAGVVIDDDAVEHGVVLQIRVLVAAQGEPATEGREEVPRSQIDVLVLEGHVPVLDRGRRDVLARGIVRGIGQLIRSVHGSQCERPHANVEIDPRVRHGRFDVVVRVVEVLPLHHAAHVDIGLGRDRG